MPRKRLKPYPKKRLYVGRFHQVDGPPQALYLATAEIIAIIPWHDIPRRLKLMALHGWRGAQCANGPIRSLVISRRGRLYPTARKLHPEDAKAPRPFHPKTTLEEGLREAGFLPVRELAEETGYHPDHLKLLARERRVAAQIVDGTWWMHRRSLEIYMQRRPARGRRGPHS